MMITVNVDDETAAKAGAIYEALGIDVETAVKMFLKRTVLEQRLPLDTSVPACTSDSSHDKVPEIRDKRTNNAITKAMVQDIWERFEHYANEGGDISSIAAEAHQATGMNQGSAFIYLTILDNLVSGKHNTRNMKMADLEYLVGQIKECLGEQSYLNAIESLKSSIPYWDKEVFGQFAAKVQFFINRLEEE